MDIVKQFGGTLARTVATTAEMISDRDLRKKAQDLITKEAGQRLRDIQNGVQNGAGQLGVRLQQGPRQIQAVLLRLQQRLEEQRLQASLQAERDAPVDVQVGPVLYEDAPQELRSRMWMALLNDPNLTGFLSEERVLESKKTLSPRSGKSKPGLASANASPSPASSLSPASYSTSPFCQVLQSPFTDADVQLEQAPGTPSAFSPRGAQLSITLNPNAASQPATPRAVFRSNSGARGSGGLDSEGFGRIPSFTSQPPTPRSLHRSITMNSRNSDTLDSPRIREHLGERLPSLSGLVERSSLRLRVATDAAPGQEISRRVRAGSLAELDSSSLRSMLRTSPTPPSPIATARGERGAAPLTPTTPRLGGAGSEDGQAASLHRGSGIAPDTPNSGNSANLSPFAYLNPVLEPPSLVVQGTPRSGASPHALGLQHSMSGGSSGKLDIDEAARRAEAFDASASSESQRQGRPLGKEEPLQSRQGLTRQRSRSLPREAGPGSREVGPTGRTSGKFMARLPSKHEINRRDVLAGILSPENDADVMSIEEQQDGELADALEERRDVLSGLDLSMGPAERSTDAQEDSFGRRTVSMGAGQSAGRSQYTFTRVKPSARPRRSEGDPPILGTPPSPLRQRIAEAAGGPSPLRGVSPLNAGGRHRRRGSVDSLHGELTPRSVASEMCPTDFSFTQADSQRLRGSRAVSPFTDWASSRTDHVTPVTPRSVDSDPGHMSPRWMMGSLPANALALPTMLTRPGDGDAPLDPNLDEWEMVQGASSLYVFSGSRLRPARLQGRRMNMDQHAETLRQRMMEAVWEVQWPINAEYAEGGRYNTLLQISIGQEDVDEVISRDIHRTFPEHPQFGFQQGQQALFRVLKAYSLHDLEVGYCQGMAFVAGVLLMYLPEEPAFKGLCRLMDSQEKGGCGLRDLYMPGLEGLKRYLRMFEWLMGRLLPQVKEQLEVFAALPVLYASQWFLTAYSCPFPSAFACRVIDIMLTEQRGDMLLRTGLAIIAHIKDQLRRLDDFEDIITYLKVEPMKWSPQRMRQVLNFAVSDFVQDDMIRAAQLAIDQGYEGTLSRRGSSLITAAEAAAAAAENQRKLEEAIQQLAEKEAAEADMGNPMAARAARPPRPPRPAAPLSSASSDPTPPLPLMAAPSLGKGKEEMEDEYMAMVMSLDTLLTGQGRA
eukprot:jgi/Botrbrau1/13756/Bobra.0056s0013.2